MLIRTPVARGPVGVVFAAVLVLLVAACTQPTPPPSPQAAGPITGEVIDLAGAPVADAEVTTDSGQARTDAQGRFSVPAVEGGSWVSVEREGFLRRTRAGTPGDPLLVRLTPDDGQTVALQFGGDVMMGRRFFDPNEDGNPGDAVLGDPGSVAQHTALLSSVAPLLRDGDISEVNVESPLADQPYIDPTQPRSVQVHPTKKFVFASGPGFPRALADSGIDVVGLANNHQYDLLEPGVRTTMDGFAAAGFRPGERQFGLGSSVDEAYRPAVVTAKGVRFAFLGCTTITGATGPLSYVAGVDKGGAAACDPIRVRDSVAAAKATGAVVVFSVHGGHEYTRDPSAEVRSVTRIAQKAGATLVMNAHPHVIGGLDWNGTSLAAWSLGNLVFDQTAWPTFETFVLTVHVRQGRVIRAYLEPLIVDGYVGHGLRPGLADYVDRTVMGRSRGPYRAENGAVELDLGGAPPPVTVTAAAPPAGVIGELGNGWSLRGATPAGAVETGKDLLWTGSFEDGVLGVGPGALWTLGPDQAVVPDPESGRGLVYRLTRSAEDPDPVIGTMTHRALLADPGAEQLQRANRDVDDDEPADLTPSGSPEDEGPTAPPRAEAAVSLTGQMQLDPGARLEVQLSWYSDTRGPSNSQAVRIFDGGARGREWQPFRLDVAAPGDAVAAQVFFRLYPPRAERGRPAPPSEVGARVDDVRLIEWSPAATSTPPGATHIRGRTGGRIDIERSPTTAGGAIPDALTVLPN